MRLWGSPPPVTKPTLAQDAPVTPMAWQSAALSNVVGQLAQMVGYGVTNAKSQTGGGTPSGSTEVEPNNTRATAQILSAAGTIQGTVGSSSDSDYFKISVPAGKTLGVNLDVPASLDFDLRLYNSSGSIIARSENDLGLDESVTWTNTGSSAVTVYVRVYGYNGSYSAIDAYKLTLSW